MQDSSIPTTCARPPVEVAPVAPPCDPIRTLVAALQQLADVLDAASDEQYVQQPVGVVPGSLGGHVRHCLDHFEALCRGAGTGLIDYDDRERGTVVETSRCAAAQALRSLKDRVACLGEQNLAGRVVVTSMLSADGATLQSHSSLGRELAFVLSHTVHHNALVAAMCRTLGIPIPERFGFAPSTIAHLDEGGCARSPSFR